MYFLLLFQDSKNVDPEMISLNDVLTPLAPGKETEDYESVFVLPKDQGRDVHQGGDVAANDSEEQSKIGTSKKARKRTKVH